MEKKNLVPLIRLAQQGDKQALLELFLNFEPSIIKYSIRYSTFINEDCYQELATQFIVAVQSFDFSKYEDK
jgi:hypothetical protein